MKPCLKSPAPSPGPEHIQTRKCVAFGAEGSEEVHFADVWDRTPTEPARKLSYQDLLELKAIQRSLPQADQPPDPISGRPATQFLSAVPITLLPLLSDSSSGDSQDSSPSPSPVATPSPAPYGPLKCWSPFPQLPQCHPSTHPRHPPHLAHLLPARPAPQRPKPRFAFLPLLDTPPTSAPASPFPSNPPSRSPSPDLPPDTYERRDPPTPSLTNASIGSSPPSRASSASPEPPSFQLPPSRKHPFSSGEYYHKAFGQSYFPPYTDGYRPDPDEVSDAVPSAIAAMRLEAFTSPPLLPPSLLLLDGRRSPTPLEKKQQPDTGSVTLKPIRRRNFIVVNDVEIEIDADEDEAPGLPTTPLATPALPELSSKSPSMDVPVPIPVPRNCSDHSPSLPPLNKGRPFMLENYTERPSSPSTSSQTVLTSPRRCTKSLHSPLRCQRATGGGRDSRPPSPISTPHCLSVSQRGSPRSSPILA